MKKYLLLISSLSLLTKMPAQHTVVGSAATAGTLFGKVVDSSGKGVVDASVVVLKLSFDPAAQTYKSKYLKGVVTKPNGEFSFTEIPFSSIQLKISASGYQEVTEFITIAETVKDIGSIKLAANITMLKDVTIRSTQLMLKMDADKLSFNVEKNMATVGGTALDVFRFVPAVQTDLDGNVKLRNATPQIFIDGRPTTLTPEQIPADAIETIEVINNPSAKYDASSGGAGIINIILKKNRKTGYHVNMRIGIDKRGGINTGGDLNLRQGKLNFSSMINLSHAKNYINGNTKQFNGYVIPHEDISQYSKMRGDVNTIFFKGSIDYFATNRTTLSANFITAKWKTQLDDYSKSLIKKTDLSSSVAERVSVTNRRFSPTGLQILIKKMFDKAGKELTADATYFSGDNSLKSTLVTDSSDMMDAVYSTENLQVVSFGSTKYFTVQSDFTSPVKSKRKIEMGTRIFGRKVANNNETFMSQNNGGFAVIPNAGNNYSYNERTYAGYVTYSGKIKKTDWQLGIRAEHYEYNGLLHSSNTRINNKYPLSLFPSLVITGKINDKGQWQMVYSRRTSRPNFINLVPYTDRTDPLNYSRGNANLAPEFTHSVNISYNHQLKAGRSILVSGYAKATTNLITRFQQKEFDPVANKEILINTYMNAKSAFTYGFEMTAVYPATKWWDFTANINIYKAGINTTNITKEQQENFWSWFGKWNNNFKLPRNYFIQLAINYQSKSSLPVGATNSDGHMAQSVTASQGYIRAFYAWDLSARKSFMKEKRANVIIAFTDILKSRWQRQYSENSYFKQNYSRIKDPQMIRLTFTYRFGKADLSLFKRRNMKAENETIQAITQ